ncbi:hypothetical protein DPMN_185564 [Dreissena polymorpha]|uniref:Uncharacterized protein n=1 Tax=Dreissena polymorpha TaxID=45954 RepID=A0A9D4DL93_DREPO|nr:hypothetical protein DPMN_185564 [Dreissena polymorpha]
MINSQRLEMTHRQRLAMTNSQRLEMTHSRLLAATSPEAWSRYENVLRRALATVYRMIMQITE